MSASVAAPRSLGGALLRRPVAAGALAFLVVLTIASFAAPWLAAWRGLDPEQVNLLARAQPPSDVHWLGTDELGRDLLLRLLYAGQVSLTVGFAAAFGAAVVGSAIGLVAGWAGGRLDALLMRLADLLMALPVLPLLVILAALDLGKLGLPPDVAGAAWTGLARIVVLIVLVGWVTVARLVRGTTLSLKRREFVLAARALGARDRTILWRHVLPNAASPIVVATTLSIGNVILLESVLSFLGLGIQPPTASWGNMLTNAQQTLWSEPMLAVWPGLFIFATVMAFNLLGDALQDELDPRGRSG